jgi:hypothetical protein
LRKDKLSQTLGSLSFRPKGEITLVTPKIVDYVCGISCAISPFGRNNKIEGFSLSKFYQLHLMKPNALALIEVEILFLASLARKRLESIAGNSF